MRWAVALVIATVLIARGLTAMFSPESVGGMCWSEPSTLRFPLEIGFPIGFPNHKYLFEFFVSIS